MKKKAFLAAAVTCAAAMALAACVPNVESPDVESNGEGAVSHQAATGTAQSLEELYSEMGEVHSSSLPSIQTLADGTQVQLAPDVDFSYWHLGDQPNSYNIKYLNANNRGCNSCHTDGLADLIMNHLSYPHIDIRNNLGMDATPMDCLICHDVGTGYVTKNFEFGSLIHGIHSRDTFKGDCMSCHNATADGKGMQLWEEAKYNVMQGLTFISNEDVNAEMSYEQDKTNEMFDLTFFTGDMNREAVDNEMKGVPTDDAARDAWEISVSGLVNNPYSITLGQLIQEAPSETFISSTQCVMNAPGWEMVSNVEVTGIPVQWLLDKAGGVKEGATALMATVSDGWSRGETLETLAKNGAYLVYKINGENLSWTEGFPVRIWYQNRGVPSSIRWVSDLEVVDTPADEVKVFEGWELDEANTLDSDMIGKWYNKPNAGICFFHEGQIIKAGEPYTFEGYAQAFDQQVTAVEFSLDNGATWTRMDTSDSDRNKWVYWNFTITPEPGSYVLAVRAVTDEGLVSMYPDKVMFNAHEA